MADNATRQALRNVQFTRTAGDWQARHTPTGLARQGRTRAIAAARILAAIAAHPDYRATLPAGAVEVDTETAYGSTVRLSRSVLVF